MSRFRLPRDVNKHVEFLHIVNFFTASQIMSLEDALPLVKEFQVRGKDVVLNIPDGLDSRFREKLDSLKCMYEEIRPGH